MNFYRMSGLSVASTIPLPGISAGVSPVAVPDICICEGPVSPGLSSPVHTGGDWQIAGDSFLLCVPGVARFLLKSGKEVLVDLYPRVPPDDAGVYLTGTVLGILLHQRARVVLHASAVRVRDRAVLFCGPSGSGKSTLAAALSQRGYPVLNDDLCVVGFDPGSPVIWSDGRQLKLWSSSVDWLKLEATRGAPVYSRDDKYYLNCAEPAPAESLPLGALYELQTSDSASIAPMAPLDALLAVRRNSFRPALIGLMHQQQQYFENGARIAAQAGVFSLRRPFELERLSTVLDRLEEHWGCLSSYEWKPKQQSIP